MDIVPLAASKFAKASVTEPFWRQRSKPAADGEHARLRKQLAELGKEFSQLLSLQQKTEAQREDFAGKTKLLRQELAAKEKQLDLCRRTVDRLTEEKAQQEGAAAAEKTYIRKLESRLLSVKNAVELQAKCAEYKAEAEHAAQQARLAEARAASAEDAAQRQQEEAACLKRGIELAAEQLTKSAGAEVPSTLLLALARAQEEGMSLSVQLADSRQQLAQMASALQHARTHLLEQRKTLEELQGEGERSARQLAEARGELESERVAVSELRHVVASLKQQVAGLRAERDELRRQLELGRTATMAAEEKVVELQAAQRQQAKAEAALRGELHQAKASARQHQQHQEQEPRRGGQAAAPSPAAPGARRPAAPTPNRGRQGLPPAAAAPARGQSSSIQRLRQSRQQQRGRGSLGADALAEPFVATEAAPSSVCQPVQQAMLGGLGVQGGLGLSGAGASASQDLEGTLPPLGPAADAAMAQAHAARQLPQRPAQRTGRGMAPALGDARLAQLYTSVLDQQIAQIEGDLAQLSASCSPVKLQRLLLHGLQKEPTLERPPTAARGNDHQQQPLGGSSVRAGCIPDAGRAGRSAPRGLLSPSSTAAASLPRKPSVPASASADPAAAAPVGPSPSKLFHPSPSKLLRPGWLARGRAAADASRPGSPGIPAWRPNSVFEPGEPDAVVLQASMPEQPSLCMGPLWACSPSAPAASGGAPRAGGGGLRAPPPPPLEIPGGASDRYSGGGLGDLSPPDSEASAPARSRRDPSPGQRQQQQQQRGQQQQAGPPPPSVQPSQARGHGSQGMVWHSNPLAAISPLGGGPGGHSPAAPSAPSEHPSSPPSPNLLMLMAQAAEAVLGDTREAQPRGGDGSSGPASPRHAGRQGQQQRRQQQQQRRQQQQQQQRSPEPLEWQHAHSDSCTNSSVSLRPQEQPQPPQQRPPQGAHVQPAERGGQQGWWEEEFDPLMRQEGGHPAQQHPASSQSLGSQQQETPACSSREATPGWQAPGGEPAAPDHHHPSQQLQQQGQGSGNSTASGGLPPGRPGSGSISTFSRRWLGAPSGASSWLNASYEPDIEQLEVNSSRKPHWQQHQQHGQQAQAVAPPELQPAAPAEAQAPATLFDLAKMDIDFL